MLILEEHSEFVYVYEFFLLPNICFNVWNIWINMFICLVQSLSTLNRLTRSIVRFADSILNNFKVIYIWK